MGRGIRKKIVKSVSVSVVLPEELLIEILLRLPVQTLLRFKCVSKEWLRLFSSQVFIQSQLDHAIKNNPRILFKTIRKCTPFWRSLDNLWSLEYGSSYTDQTRYKTKFSRNYTISGSCNGLVCLKDSSIILCNPATREYIEVPDCYDSLFGNCYGRLGFGHDPLTNTYKLVKIFCSEYPQFPDCDVDVHVYTFGTKKWRRISTSSLPTIMLSSNPYDFPCYLADRGPCLNGVLHWGLISATSSRDMPSFDSIVGFHVGKEEFRQIPWIPTSTANQTTACLGEIQGCLSLFSTSDDGMTDIWYMKDYGAQESWTKLYSLSPSDDRIQSLVFLKKTETLISITSERKQENLYTYDPTNNRVCQYAPFSWGFENGVQAYVESLVSITSLNMGNRQLQKNRRPLDQHNL